jgi:hypothetical protein
MWVIRSPKRDIEERFWEKVDKSGGPDACWLWLAHKGNKGYGSFAVNGREPRAHRWAYERFVGPIPEGLLLDHLCRTPACVNPAHLEPVTNLENLRRGKSVRTMLNAQKTECLHGHPYTAENTYVGPRKPNRECRTCRSDKGRLRNATRSVG